MKTLIRAAAWWAKSGWVFAALLSLVTARWIDVRLFPVVEKFTVTSMVVVPTGIELSGVLRKPSWREPCRFGEVVAHVNDNSVVPVEFLDRKPGQGASTRPSGVSSWGPWRIEAPAINTVRLVSRHRCHGLWDHTTTLAEITVKQ